MVELGQGQEMGTADGMQIIQNALRLMKIHSSNLVTKQEMDQK
jgi:hypothetical protein